MSDIRVKGYDDITFWQEEGIGLIVLRSPDNGLLRPNVINELITSLGTAAIDDKVKAIGMTGINDNFSRGISMENITIIEAQQLLESTNALASIIYSIEKPIFSILNGNAIDAGYEIALLTDVIISSNSAKVGFSPNHKFILGGSLTLSRFRRLQINEAEEGKNVDKVFNRENLLNDSKDYILQNLGYDYHLIRRNLMRDLKGAMMEERDAFMKNALKTYL